MALQQSKISTLFLGKSVGMITTMSEICRVNRHARRNQVQEDNG